MHGFTKDAENTLVLCALTTNVKSSSFFNRIPPLGKAFLLFLLIILALIVLFPPEARKVRCEETVFAGRASNSIYFHNVRSFYYRFSEKPQEGMNQFIFKKSIEDPIQFLLVEFPLNEEWHIRPFTADSNLTSAVFFTTEYCLQTDTARSEDYWLLAKAIYSDVLDGLPIRIQSGSKEFAAMVTEEERQRAKTVLFDYFRLIGCN